MRLMLPVMAAGAAQAAEDRQSLWRIVRTCASAYRLAGISFPCLKVDLPGGPSCAAERHAHVRRGPADVAVGSLAPVRRTLEECCVSGKTSWRDQSSTVAKSLVSCAPFIGCFERGADGSDGSDYFLFGCSNKPSIDAIATVASQPIAFSKGRRANWPMTLFREAISSAPAWRRPPAPGTYRGDRRVSRPQMGKRTRLSTDQGAVGVHREPHRGALRLRFVAVTPAKSDSSRPLGP